MAVLPVAKMYVCLLLYLSSRRNCGTAMPLKGIPSAITPDLLYALAKMGHGDCIIIADANFPSDSISSTCIVSTPIRVTGVSTTELLEHILTLMPLDQYMEKPLGVMDRVASDKARDLRVPTYANAALTAGLSVEHLDYIERFDFYERAKRAFAVIQTDDKALYANLLVYKGVI